MKTCKTCNISKPLTDFYRAGRNREYSSSYCKLCSHKKAAIWNMENRKSSKEARRKNKIYDKHHAVHMIVFKALQNGELEKKPCIVCGTMDKLNAHHNDYEKPLDVEWYCYAHHMQLHSDKRRSTENKNPPAGVEGSY